MIHSLSNHLESFKSLLPSCSNFIPSKTVEKTVAVAIGCFILFSCQFGCAIGISSAIALGCASLTLLSELTIRKSLLDKKWFSFNDFNVKEFKQLFVASLKANLIGILIFKILKVSIEQSFTHLLRAGDLKMMALAVIIAPLTEEILFRGFIKERLEDGLQLINKHIYSIKKETQSKISNCGQAILFGAAHINEKQSSRANTVIFIGTSVFGFNCAKSKEKNNLFFSICEHSLHNSFLTFRLFTFGG